MNYFTLALKKYAQFSGRSTRSEYWFFMLVYNLIILLLGAVGWFLQEPTVGEIAGIISLVFVLGMIIPSISVTVRRLHDIGKNGWTLFLLLIPIIWAIWLFVLMCFKSNPGDNKYGPEPKA